VSIKFGYAWQGIGYFIVGIGATFYGPAKYGILPEILPRERLVKANGMVELLTLVAILGGGIGGSVIVDKLSVSWCYVILVMIYGASFGLNLFMEGTPSNPAIRLSASVGEFFGHFRSLLTAPRLGKVLIGTALFWVCGAAMKINFQAWGLAVLHLPNNTQIALLGLWLSVGLMIGSILAGQLHRVGDLVWTRRYGFTLAGMLALVFTVEDFEFWRAPVVKFADPGMFAGLQLIIPVVFLLIATGFVAGLFLIPLNAALQAESDPDKLGKTIATQNFTDNCGMIFAGLYCFACVKMHLSASQVFLGLALILAAIVAWLRIPQRPVEKTS
jgi:LPLT family lysophospholipid transporter-like MFS transporter